jgi:hypothetical protein
MDQNLIEEPVKGTIPARQGQELINCGLAGRLVFEVGFHPFALKRSVGYHPITNRSGPQVVGHVTLSRALPVVRVFDSQFDPRPEVNPAIPNAGMAGEDIREGRLLGLGRAEEIIRIRGHHSKQRRTPGGAGRNQQRSSQYRHVRS